MKKCPKLVVLKILEQNSKTLGIGNSYNNPASKFPGAIMLIINQKIIFKVGFIWNLYGEKWVIFFLIRFTSSSNKTTKKFLTCCIVTKTYSHIRYTVDVTAKKYRNFHFYQTFGPLFKE
jgi:hypothetical protein